MKKLILGILLLMVVFLTACQKSQNQDTTKPIILVSGGSQAILVGDIFVFPSVFVSDNQDEDIDVVVSGDLVNTNQAGTYTILYDAKDSSGNEAIQKSFTVTVFSYQENMDILNGGFEIGTLSGWTIETVNGFSDAFHDDYVIDTANRKEGTYFFDGSKTDDDKTGAITSSIFVLGGSGWIHFRLGGGNDIDHLFLAVYRASNNEMVAKFANSNPQKYGGNEFLVGYKFNLLTINDISLGETFYIKVVDSKLENWAIIKIDDIKTFNIVEPSNILYETVLNQI